MIDWVVVWSCVGGVAAVAAVAGFVFWCCLAVAGRKSRDEDYRP